MDMLIDQGEMAHQKKNGLKEMAHHSNTDPPLKKTALQQQAAG